MSPHGRTALALGASFLMLTCLVGLIRLNSRVATTSSWLQNLQTPPQASVLYTLELTQDKAFGLEIGEEFACTNGEQRLPPADHPDWGYRVRAIERTESNTLVAVEVEAAGVADARKCASEAWYLVTRAVRKPGAAGAP